MADINIAAVLTLAVAYLLFASLWYSPILFGIHWLQAKGIEENPSFCARTYSATFFVTLFASAAMQQLIRMLDVHTLLEGAKVGILVWFGFVLTTQLFMVLWEECPLKVFFINTGCAVIALPVMGALFAIW